MQLPSRPTNEHAGAMSPPGWSEEALFNAIRVAASCSFINRIVEGTGVVTDPAVLAGERERHEALRDDPTPYQTYGKMPGII